MRDFVLTEDQQRLAEENLRLASHFYKKYKKPIGMESDDWYQEILYALCKAAAWWNPELGTFSTLFGRLVRWQWMDCRTRINRDQFRSLDQSFKGNSDLSSLKDCLVGDEPDCTIEASDEVNSMLNDYPEEWREVCMQVISGKGFTADSAKVITRIRKLKGAGSGRIGCCHSCGDIFHAAWSGPIKNCRICSRLLDLENMRNQKFKKKLRKASNPDSLTSSHLETAIGN